MSCLRGGDKNDAIDNPFLSSLHRAHELHSRRSIRQQASGRDHAETSPASIEQLDAYSSRLIASTLRFPSLGSILDCLLRNSLQAGAKKVDVWVNVSPDSAGMANGAETEVSLEVQDDGGGIGRWELDEVGEWRDAAGEDGEVVSEDGTGEEVDRRPEGGLQAGAGVGYGTSLAAIAQFSLLDITTSQASIYPASDTADSRQQTPMAHRMPRPSNNHNLRSATPRTPITPFLASPGTQHPSQKIRKGGKTLFCGPVKKSLGREQGTTVVVRDMYHNRTLLASSQSITSQCKKAVEAIGLVNPGVQFNLYERRMNAFQGTGGEVRHVAGVSAGRKKSIDVFRDLFGRAGVERVQNIRVSSGRMRMDGFISVEGSINRHLYIDSHPVPSGELQALISKKFARSRFSAYAEDGLDDAAPTSIRKSPRRLERYPTYVLDVTSTSNQATTPGRGATAHHSPLTRSASSGYSIAGRPAGQLPIELDQDELERFEKFLGAVIDEFLLRHGFTAKTYLLPDQTDPIDRAVSAPVQRGSAMLAPPVTPVRAASSLAKFDCRVTSPRAQLHLRNVSVHSSSVPSDPATPRTAESYPEGLDGSIGSRKRQRTDNSHASRVGTESRSALQPPAKRSDLSSAEAPGTPPPRSEHEAGAAEELDMSFSVDASGRKRYKWIEDIVGNIDTGLLPFASRPAVQLEGTSNEDDWDGSQHDCQSCSQAKMSTPLRKCHSTSRQRGPAERYFDALPSLLSPDHTPMPRLRDPIRLKPTDVSFSHEAIANARVIQQVDDKFIACIIKAARTSNGTAGREMGRSDAGSSSPDVGSKVDVLVLIDQHAADERVSVEPIFAELCSGFVSDTVETVRLQGVGIVLSREEGAMLRSPGVREFIARWGIQLSIGSSKDSTDGRHAGDEASGVKTGGGEGDYVQVEVQAVPAVLKARLGRKEGKEMMRLSKVYLPFLVENIGQIQALLKRGRATNGSTGCDGLIAGGEVDSDLGGDWTAVHRYMPLEMVELVNSKACRNAIMFGDRLTLDQCSRLIAQLGHTRYPFICAHGRPTAVPLLVLEDVADHVAPRRVIDWDRWRAHNEP